MATFDFRIKKPNTYGYRLLAVPRANSISADGISNNSVVGRIIHEDPTKPIPTTTVAWKKARTRHALFSGREVSSGQVSTDAEGYFTLTGITADSTPGPWLMSFEALVGGKLIGDVVFWHEIPDIVKGTENSNGIAEALIEAETEAHDYTEFQYEIYSYEESATPNTQKPHPWLPPTWYAVSPEDQHNMDTDFNLSGYVGGREYTSSGILGRASSVYSPRFVEPINGDLYDTSGGGNSLTTAASPEISSFDGIAYLWYPGTVSNHASVSAPTVRVGDVVASVTVELADYTPASNQVLFDDHESSSGIKATLVTDGTISINLEASTYVTTNPSLIDGNKYTFEFETDFLATQLITNIYDRNHNLIFRELATITETSVGASSAVYVGAQRDNTQHIAGKLYDFYLQDQSGILSSFNFSASYFPSGISSSSGTDEVGNTITLTRSSTGHKLTLFDRPAFSNKSDTYFTSSSTGLDFGTRSLTMVLVLNYWNQPAASEPLLMKKATVSTVADEGYALYISSSGSVYFRSSDGTTQNTRSIPSREGAGLHYIAVVGDRNGDTIKIMDDVNQDSAAWGINSIDAPDAFTFMNDAGFANGFQGNVVGAALFKEALTDSEVQEVARKLGMDA